MLLWCIHAATDDQPRRQRGCEHGSHFDPESGQMGGDRRRPALRRRRAVPSVPTASNAATPVFTASVSFSLSTTNAASLGTAAVRPTDGTDYVRVGG